MMSSSDRADPRHFDGGASLLLGAITIYGRRRVLLMCSGTPDITLTQDSGDFYLAAMCAIEHQVLHEAAVPGELIQLDAVGQVKVSVLLRGTSFRWSRGAMRANPTVVFEAVQGVICKWLSEASLHPPSLEQCLAVHNAHSIENSMYLGLLLTLRMYLGSCMLCLGYRRLLFRISTAIFGRLPVVVGI